MPGTQDHHDNNHVTTDSTQTGIQTGLGTTIIECLKRVASGGNANRAEPDQTAPVGAGCSGSPLFAKKLKGVTIGEMVNSDVTEPYIKYTLPAMGQFMKFDMAVPQFTLKDVGCHSDSSSCWIVLADKVYDVTDFLINHPGGEEIILENAGTDATVPFESKGHSSDATEQLSEYCIGELVESDRRYKT